MWRKTLIVFVLVAGSSTATTAQIGTEIVHPQEDLCDPTSGPREKLLQEIAWNAVVAEPKSGVKGKPVKLG